MTYQISPVPVYYQANGEDGPYTAKSHGVEAVSPAGEVYRHFRADLSEDDAFGLVERIQQSIANGQAFDPAESDYWYFERRVYGSEAYQANEWAETHHQQRLDVEAEFGPGSYRPGQPGYLERVPRGI